MKTRTTHCQKPSGFSQNQSLPVFPETVVGALCSDATEPHLGEYLVTWPPLGRLWAHVHVPCTPSVLLEDWQCFLHLPSTFCGKASSARHCPIRSAALPRARNDLLAITVGRPYGLLAALGAPYRPDWRSDLQRYGRGVLCQRRLFVLGGELFLDFSHSDPGQRTEYSPQNSRLGHRAIQ